MKKNFRKKENGFTLVELLVSLIILALITSVAVFAVTSIISSSKDKLSDTSKKLIIDAANTYAIEFRNSSKWDEAINEDGSISFCVSLVSLINAGYYSGDSKEINKYKNDYVVKVDLIDGVFNYMIVKITETNKYCSYYSGNSDINNGSGTIDVTDDNNEKIGNLNYKVTGIDDYNYMATIDFKAILGLKDIEVNAPLYVAIVLDNSGSMTANNGWNNAKQAAIKLSEEIINSSDTSYVSLVQYTETVKVKREFEHNPLTASNFNLATGYTNTSGGLAMAASLFEKIEDKENADFYTILLYDGEPTHYSYFNASGKWLYPDGTDNNYYIKFNKYSLYNSRCNSTPTCVNYIVNSNNYLKNNLKSKVITIGYNMQPSSDVTEDDLNNMKESSTQDNTFCANSNYSKKTTKYSGAVYTNKASDLKSNQTAYPFKLSGSALVSSNSGIPNSISEMRLKIDLTNRPGYTVRLNSTINSSGSNNFGYVTAQAQGYTPLSKLQSCQNSGNFNSSDYSICFINSSTANGYGFGFFAETINYINFAYVKYGNSYVGSDNFRLNYITLDGPSTTAVDMSSRTSFSNGNNIVNPFTQNGNSIVSTNQNINYSQSYANNEIDLSNDSNSYILDANVSVSSNYGHDLGFVIINTDNFNPIMPATSKYYVYNNYSTYMPNNVDNKCGSTDKKCVSGTYNKTYTFYIKGNKKYYLHYIYNRQNVSANNNNFNVNNLSIYKLTKTLYTGSAIKPNNTYIGELVTPSTYGFMSSGSSIISNSKEISNSQAHSYNKLDLSSFSSTQKIAIGFNTNVSSETNADYGNIVISTSTNIPTLVNGSCTDSSDGICVASISGYNSGTFYKTLDGGKIYYIHYIYSKNDSTNSSNDNFSISNISLSETENSTKTNFPISSNNYFSDLNQGKSYFFNESNGTYTSTNKGITNSRSHSYYKVDLSNYSSGKTFFISVDTTISSNNGYGSLIITSSPNTPQFGDEINFDYDNTDIYATIATYITGDKTQTYSTPLYGGRVYYLHFFYTNSSNIVDNYNDMFKINSIKFYPSVTRNLTFPISDDYNFVTVENPKDYPFEAKDNKYVSTNKNIIGSTSSGYVKIDLSSYSSSKTYKLVTNATISATKENYGSLILTTTASTPKIYKGVYNATYYPDDLVSYFGNEITGKSTKDYITNITGGKVYYLHFIYYKDSYSSNDDTFTINSINVFENSNDEYNSYCYYDSNSDQIDNLFNNIISKKIIESVEKFSAKKAILTLTPGKLENGYGFKILNENNELVNKITKEIDLSNVSQTENAIIDISGEYHLVVDDKLFDECKEKNKNSSETAVSCTATLKIFDIKIDLFDSNNKLQKTISVDNAPSVTISTKIHDTIN